MSLYYTRFRSIFACLRRPGVDLFEVLEIRKDARKTLSDPEASKEDKEEAQEYLDDSDALIIARSIGEW